MSARVKWSPSDAELDALARGTPAPQRDADRVEQGRTAVLASAAGATQLRRRSIAPYVAIAGSLAAAAVLWLVLRPDAGPKETITPIGVAHYARTTGWPDFVVSLDEGRVAVRVSALDEGERFRVITSDAEIEVRGTRFVAGAAKSQLAWVEVIEGRVEIRRTGDAPVFLAAGQTWQPARIAQVIEPEAAPAPVESPESTLPQPVVAAPVQPPVVAAPVTKNRVAKAPVVEPPAKETHERPSTVEKPALETPIVKAPDELPAPGESDFRSGIALLRGGDAAGAVKAFAAACAASGGAIREDACFWHGAAAKRAGQTTVARESLERFLAQFPSSSRAGEAAALVGWILYDAGKLDEAEQRFKQAEHDRVPRVRESAERGLSAIKRTRESKR